MLTRRTHLKLLAGTALVAAGVANGASLPARAATLTPEVAKAIAVEAYIYAYSLITSEITRVQMTNVPKQEGLRGPIGAFINVKRYPPADYRGVSAPNADTLYSLAWVDVGGEPWVFSHPDMGDRYYLFPMYSLWMPVIASPGKRTAGGQARSYAITGPGWKGTLPDGVEQIQSTTRYLVILGRTYCTGTEEDYAAVNALQSQYKLTPLSAYGKDFTPTPPKVDPDPGFSMTDKVRDAINAMDTATYFNLFTALMADNPPVAEDAAIIARMAEIGLVPGQAFALEKLDPAVQGALRDVGEVGFRQISESQRKAGTIQNGWVLPSVVGTYGTDYLNRAMIAAYGWPANLPEDAVYPFTDVDVTGRRLSGKNSYVLRFAKGKTPPVNGFWSITMYDSEYFFVPNALNKFTVSPRDALVYNDDGSLDLHFQQDSPGKEREANWLPAPAGDFILMMRLYWSRETPPSILPMGKGSWEVPGVQKIG